MAKRLITFLTGTRADFGKLLPLIRKVKSSRQNQLEVVATGMHLLTNYGYTIREIRKAGIRNVFPIFNQDSSTSEKMDIVLANTITQLSHYLNERRPDLFIVHGDRIEALAGVIAGSLNNISVGHIEGGETSGTIDESIRHAISKMAHVHFVSNGDARRRLLQMGESEGSIFVIGSPEVDVMLRDDLPDLEQTKKRYGVKFEDYALLIYHPVTTERETTEQHISEVIEALDRTDHNFIAVKANNDIGSDVINSRLAKFGKLDRVKLFPSLRFEYYLTFLKNARYIIGNSSSGIREAPVFGVPCINIGTRQTNRTENSAIVNAREDTDVIFSAIMSLPDRVEQTAYFGDGKAAERFSEMLDGEEVWSIPTQKRFFDRIIENA